MITSSLVQTHVQSKVTQFFILLVRGMLHLHAILPFIHISTIKTYNTYAFTANTSDNLIMNFQLFLLTVMFLIVLTAFYWHHVSKVFFIQIIIKFKIFSEVPNESFTFEPINQNLRIVIT